MEVKTYIKEFEKLGFGLFVHFGLYSIVGKGGVVSAPESRSRSEEV